MPQKIIAIVGPKGGIGKSTISANLAIAIAATGKKTIAVDLDLGGANLHVILGVRSYEYSLDDFVLKHIKTLDKALIETNIPNLKLICGGSKIPDIANMPFQQKVKLIGHISKLNCDVVILDLAAGSAFNVVDFLFIAQVGLLVTSPEVTSLMKAYGFIKTAIFRLLTFHFKQRHTELFMELLEKAKDVDANPALNTIEKFLKEAEKIDAELVESARKKIARFTPSFVINMVQSARDINTGMVIQNLVKQYTNINTRVMITLPSDEAVKRALFKTKPVLLSEPMSPFSIAIKELAYKCMNTG
ncbi:AAA family ATPase [Candidatus Magnetominusculus dajiuhuensis]|uniref:nucleotide-binding protein n=1 Tax=Candidatus Magnetominusculus dajiuhuensis TaxID=3137712 RepID=UPI003B430112